MFTSFQDLFDNLLRAVTSAQVKRILTNLGDSSSVGLDDQFGNLQLHWHPYGDKTSNYSTIGMASQPGRSLTERITNALDAVVEERALTAQTHPQSPQKAVNEWFGRPLSSGTTGLFDWKYADGSNDRKVGVILHDSGTPQSPTVDVLDLGIGIPGELFTTTILSLQQENKIKKKYLVGAFGQGGSSTLAFCDYVLVVSRHVQEPRIVSFTLIKEMPLGEDYKENCYAYLAIHSSQGRRVVPQFQLDDPILLYAHDKPRMNELNKGTLVRHYAFKLAGISKSLSPSEGNLYHYLHGSLFDPLLPFQLIDLRNQEKPKQEISTGSRNRLMKLTMKAEDEMDSSNSQCRLYRPFVYIRPHGAITECVRIEYWVVFNYEKKRDKKTGKEYQDLRSSSSALYIQRNHLAVVTLNGQNQGERTISGVTRGLGLDLVSKHMVIHIDATEAPKEIKKQLFTTSRESLREGEVLESIVAELRRILKEDIDLALLQKELEEKHISEVTESTDDEVKKQIVRLLREIGFTPKDEGDTSKSGSGDITDDPTSPPGPPFTPPDPLPTLPYPEVTRFEIVSAERIRVPVNRTTLVKVETDADVKYQDEIRLKVDPPSLVISARFQLEGGRIKWRLKVAEEAKVGGKGSVSVSLTKPDGDQLRDEIQYEIVDAVERQSQDAPGSIPDFEVLPTAPGEATWPKAWEEIEEDSPEAFQVAYVPRRVGEDKIIVWFSQVFPPFKDMFDTLSQAGSPLLRFFETTYKVWIGYHAILQHNSQKDDSFENDEQEQVLNSQREKERALVAQMQVKQAYKAAEIMLALSKQELATSE